MKRISCLISIFILIALITVGQNSDTTKVKMLVSFDGYKSPQDHKLFGGQFIGKETFSVIGYEIKKQDGTVSYMNHKKQVVDDFVTVWMVRRFNWR